MGGGGWVGTDPQVDDGGGGQDPHAVQEVAQHVDERRPHAGVAVGVAPLPALATRGFRGHAVAVAVGAAPRLMEDQRHPGTQEADDIQAVF